MWRSIPTYGKVLCITVPVAGGVLIHRNRSEAPFTGRKRLILLSEETEARFGNSSFREIIRSNRDKILPKSHPKAKMVEKVGKRIASVSGRSDFNWEFVVIDSPQLNAFVLPGGKVCVYTGMFKVLPNEASLAAVLSHEAGHAVARHVAEKMTLSNLFLALLLLIDPNAVQLTRMVYAFGIELPFSRKFESEADSIGLQLMARACYDPNESPRMFQRMEQLQESKNFKYLSTHPPNHERVQELKKQLPHAMKLYSKYCSDTQQAYYYFDQLL